jgi:hypothetical protein
LKADFHPNVCIFFVLARPQDFVLRLQLSFTFEEHVKSKRKVNKQKLNYNTKNKSKATHKISKIRDADSNSPFQAKSDLDLGMGGSLIVDLSRDQQTATLSRESIQVVGNSIASSLQLIHVEVALL